MNFAKRLRIEPGTKLRLKDIDPGDTMGVKDKESADQERAAHLEKLAKFSELLWADNRYAVLAVLQGMDTCGKDGTIRRVMSGVNPRDCRVVSFKRPSDEELDHEFLWRIHKACPAHGEIGVFNRSHYEDVVIVRVHNLVPEKVWSKRYDQINSFEEILTHNGTRIIKFFLHISKDEQKRRLEARIQDPVKNWKMEPADLEERKHWDEYMEAYEAAISKCNSEDAPWYVIPSDKKWFRNLAVSSILVETLESLDLKPPKPKYDLSKLKVE
jgi:PPK2 family polyphosphate:nucleotide phosphotransferase